MNSIVKRFLRWALHFEAHFIASALIIVAVLIGVVLISDLRKLIFILILMILAVAPTIYKRWIPIAIGIEFMAFSTILTGIYYGSTAGFLFGATAVILSDIFAATIGEWTFLGAFGMGFGGAVAGLIGHHSNIFITGLVSLISIELIRQIPPYIFGEGEQRMMSVAYTIIHVCFTLWLFSLVSPWLGIGKFAIPVFI